MKAGFFDPYLDTVGGGERYTLTLAEYLLGEGWEVDLFWDNPQIKTTLESKLNLDLKRVNLISNPKNVFEKWRINRNYDLFFWLSDGSMPFLFSKKNILHFQVPFRNVGGKSFTNQIKLRRIHQVVCNSNFTKSFIDQEFSVSSKVIYPPVDVEKFKFGKKENIILCVGRFSQLLQAKRQDILVEVFKKMINEGLKDWKLILAGGTEVGGENYFNQLKRKGESYPIEFIKNPTFSNLQKLYSQAKIFWSASGFGIDENKQPEKVEHFGITTVEAMAAGCVPVVVGKGGAKEIIQTNENGFLWQTENELEQQTLNLARNSTLLQKIIGNVVKSSEKFSKMEFCQEFNEIIS